MEHQPGLNPAAPPHLPPFVTAPGQSDWLLTVMAVFLVAAVVSVGLFTHNHIFWIAALLLALVELPDFSTPMNSIARSLERLSGRERAKGEGSPWDDLVSDDGPPEPPLPAPAPPGKEA
jgi:hypothetical protein